MVQVGGRHPEGGGDGVVVMRHGLHRVDEGVGVVIAEGAGDDETLDSLNEYAHTLTEKLQKLLDLRSQASKIFDAVEFMRDIGLEF